MIDHLKKFSKDFILFKDKYEDQFILGYLLGQNFADNEDSLYQSLLQLNKLRCQGTITNEDKIKILNKATQQCTGLLSDKIMKLCQQLENKKIFVNLLIQKQNTLCILCEKQIQRDSECYQSSCCRVKLHGKCLAKVISNNLMNRNSILCIVCNNNISPTDLFKLGRFANDQELKIIENQIQILSNQSGNTWEYTQTQTNEMFEKIMMSKQKSLQSKKSNSDMFKNYQFQPCNQMIQNVYGNKFNLNRSTILEVEESEYQYNRSIQNQQEKLDNLQIIDFEEISLRNNEENSINRKRQNLIPSSSSNSNNYPSLPRDPYKLQNANNELQNYISERKMNNISIHQNKQFN